MTTTYKYVLPNCVIMHMSILALSILSPLICLNKIVICVLKYEVKMPYVGKSLFRVINVNELLHIIYGNMIWHIHRHVICLSLLIC
jgi:hypothetical protein